MVLLLVLAFITFNSAKKCDKYVTGAVWIHTTNGDEDATYAGCKKGCFDNATYDDNAVKKCEKCSLIEDERYCEAQRGCQWKKKKTKCAATSCPQMAKNLNKFTNGGGSWQLKQCIEGKPEQKFYNDIYFQKFVVLNEDITDFKTQAVTFLGLGWPLNTPDLNRKICENNFNATKVKDKSENLDTLPEYFADGYYKSASEFISAWITKGMQDCAERFQLDLETFKCTNFIYKAPPTNHIGTKSARKECHHVYGCMYSKSNGRCSVWAVWALVFVLVLMIVIGVAAVGGVGFVLLKLKS